MRARVSAKAASERKRSTPNAQRPTSNKRRVEALKGCRVEGCRLEGCRLEAGDCSSKTKVTSMSMKNDEAQ